AQPPSGSRALQLVNRQGAVQLGLGLDGLCPAPPNAAEPEGDSSILEDVFRGIEIDASERPCLPAVADELQFLRARPQPSRHRFIDDELELDLGHVTDLRRLYYNLLQIDGASNIHDNQAPSAGESPVLPNLSGNSVSGNLT